MPVLPLPVKSTFPFRPGTEQNVPDVPLTKPIVRLVFGDVRGSAPAIAWRSERPGHPVSLECASSAKQAFTLPVPHNEPVLDSWVDFTAHKLSGFELFFTLSCDDGGKTSARCCLLGEELGDLAGLLQRPMVDTVGNLIAVLTVSYLVVKPFETGYSVYEDFDFSGAMRAMDSAALNLSWFTGHRGMGKTKPDLPRENTVHSFIEATAHVDVNTVELDVQLTKDGRPLVYHDWFFRSHGRDKDEDRSNLAVAPYCLTLREFQHLYSSGAREEACIASSTSNAAITGRSDDTDVRFALARDEARTLAQVCVHLPEDIGLMVEVKYPCPAVQARDAIAFPERNELVDRVLHDLFSVASNSRRTIVLLTFDPDVALMLALKQRVFPVYFSHCGGIDPPCEVEDPRCVDVAQGVDFAAANGMKGMLFYEKLLSESYAPHSPSSALPPAIEYAKQRGLDVVTYGSDNSDAVWASKQIRMGVDSVIADRVKVLADDCGALIGEEKVAVKRRSHRSGSTKGNKMKIERNGLNGRIKDSPKFTDYDLFTYR